MKSRAIMFLEIFAALFHFDEHDRFPDVIGEGRSTAVLGRFQNTKVRRIANVKRALQSEALKKSVEKDLGLPFFIAGDATVEPIDERAKWFGVRNGKVLRE